MPPVIYPLIWDTGQVLVDWDLPELTSNTGSYRLELFMTYTQS